LVEKCKYGLIFFFCFCKNPLPTHYLQPGET